eukprot:contig_18981_g4679
MTWQLWTWTRGHPLGLRPELVRRAACRCSSHGRCGGLGRLHSWRLRHCSTPLMRIASVAFIVGTLFSFSLSHHGVCP